MEIVLKISAVAVMGVLIAAILRRSMSEMSIAVTLISQIVISVVALGAVGVVIRFLKELADVAGISAELLAPLIKTIGVSITTKLACDTCRDGGSTSLASYIELVGGAVAVSLSMPLVFSVLRIISI